ncbi:sigma-54-dependent transcriptional regulator [Nitrospira moscoviensis]|uniref:Sigma-54 dependent transcriptional regulator n=1 Tax=Nitrospira moscoviensis TaxID=42253 RepID=A0A0K2GEB8_NITMO|nr:sigma-54 dependent transcriptional regulator [Nitrospira moscoviensis]ALA59301.1 Sigma-54 dependent transcriptional regulator [Nitrospira moscoviensis]
MRAKILIIDDDPDIVLALENRVTWMGHEPVTAGNGKDGLRLLQQEQPDLVLLDIQLPGLSGLDVLQHLAGLARHEDAPSRWLSGSIMPPVIMLTAFGTIELAVKAMQLGAADFVTKPFTGDHISVVINKTLAALSLRRQVDALQREVADRYGPIVGDNKKLLEQLGLARQAAASTVTVLVLGETGTGKEVVARAIHGWSPRKDKPFVAVNCAAIPKDLLENELFGHEKGAFTGAVKREAGKIEIAEGGTVFLDEIGDMSLSLQSHLLRVLQDQTFYRVGGTQPVHTDVRFLAATNKDLKQAIKQGAFREDLYYRLEVISITLPPLRERMDDVPALARHFLGQSAKFGIAGKPTLSEAALGVLTRYHWPGNIRELENVLTRAVILSAGGVIEPHHLHLSSSASPAQEPDHTEEPRFYHEKMEAYSRKVLLEALHRNDWNQTRAAEDLGLQRTYFTKMLRQKNISGRPPRPGSSDSWTNS